MALWDHIIFKRNSEAKFYDRFGNLKKVSGDKQRNAYDPNTGMYRGVLCESPKHEEIYLSPEPIIRTHGQGITFFVTISHTDDEVGKASPVIELTDQDFVLYRNRLGYVNTDPDIHDALYAPTTLVKDAHNDIAVSFDSTGRRISLNGSGSENKLGTRLFETGAPQEFSNEETRIGIVRFMIFPYAMTLGEINRLTERK